MLSINFSPFPVLTTERLQLRQLVPGDAEQIFRLRSNDQVNRFIGRTQYLAASEALTFINKINRSVSNNESVYWAICFKGNPELVGTICLWNIQPENYRAEIGYELHPENWGKGIMSEAIDRIIEYGFNTMRLHSIQADTDPANSQSVSLLEKAGFLKEGHFTESVYSNGHFSDMAVYSIVSRANN